MDAEEFKKRAKQPALRIIRLVDSLPPGRSAEVTGRQLLRAGTSIGANYRAACRAQSAKAMLAKLKIVEEEADESAYWLELISECQLVAPQRITDLQREIGEILAVTVASIKTPRQKLENQSRQSSIVNRQSHNRQS